MEILLFIVLGTLFYFSFKSTQRSVNALNFEGIATGVPERLPRRKNDFTKANSGCFFHRDTRWSFESRPSCHSRDAAARVTDRLNFFEPINAQCGPA